MSSAGGYAHAHGRVLLTAVFEHVCLAGLDDEDVAGLGVDPLQAPAEADVPGEDLEALLLVGVHVHARHRAVGGQLDVDLQILAVRVGRGLAERDLLAAYRVHDGLSCVCHLVAPRRWGSFDTTSLGAGGRRVVGREDDWVLLKVDNSRWPRGVCRHPGSTEGVRLLASLTVRRGDGRGKLASAARHSSLHDLAGTRSFISTRTTCVSTVVSETTSGEQTS
jgi:hypothetical protein